MAGVSRLQYTTDVKLIRVMCTGRVDLEMPLQAFSLGADGVFITGCRLGECNYTTSGNYDALNVVLLTKRILERIGINPDRLRIEFMSSGDGIKFAEFVNEFGRNIRTLGALGKSEGLAENELKAGLAEAVSLTPYIKIAKNEKLGVRLQNPATWQDYFTTEEVSELFNEAASYYIDPVACQACGICARRCPVDAIDGGKSLIHIIDQDKCVRCGVCLQVCPQRFDAVRKMSQIDVPQPISESARLISRG